MVGKYGIIILFVLKARVAWRVVIHSIFGLGPSALGMGESFLIIESQETAS